MKKKSLVLPVTHKKPSDVPSLAAQNKCVCSILQCDWNMLNMVNMVYQINPRHKLDLLNPQKSSKKRKIIIWALVCKSVRVERRIRKGPFFFSWWHVLCVITLRWLQPFQICVSRGQTEAGTLWLWGRARAVQLLSPLTASPLLH